MSDRPRPLTIRELVEIPSFQSEIVAGHGGSEQEVLWAHSCELDEPWQWLEHGELLLTVGYCVPHDPAAQVRFVTELSQSGVVGAMIGFRDKNLRLSDEMLERANELGFPIITTKREVPWSAVSRTVAAASSIPLARQMLKIAKLYELVAGAHDDPDLMGRIAAHTGVECALRDEESGAWLAQSPKFESDLPLESGTRQRSLTLNTRYPVTLRTQEPDGDGGLATLLFVHLRRVLEVHADRLLFQYAHEYFSRAEPLNELLAGALSVKLDSMLGTKWRNDQYVVLAIREAKLRTAALRLLTAGVPMLITEAHEVAAVVVPKKDLERTKAQFADCGIVAGCSAPLDDLRDARHALTEAKSALADAELSSRGWAQFRAVTRLMFARSDREASDVIDEVLGVLAGTGRRERELRTTLFAFLRHERSWTDAADSLGIHRQTLGYRLKQIEDVTGRTLSRTEDIAAFWFAMQAWEHTHRTS